MKRSREEVAPAAPMPPPRQDAALATSPASSSALYFEVIYGITSRRSSSLEAERAAVASRLLGAASTALSATAASSQVSSSSVATAVDVALLLEDEVSVSLGGFCRELLYRQLQHSSEEGSLLRLLTVELVANDGRTLVLASSPSDATSNNTEPSPTLLMDVGWSTQTGAGDAFNAHPADLLLIRSQPRKPNMMEGDTSSSGAEWAAHAEFVAYNSAFFTAQDVDLWREAVEGSITVVVRWLASLLEQPPGLAQLTFLEANAASSSSAEGSFGEGWRRTLQLPVLLRVKPEVMRSADTATLDRLRRTILFAFRTLVSVFQNVELLMRLPRLCQRLALLFLASPLYVDGASQVSMQLTASDSMASTRRSMTQLLRSCLELGLSYASACSAWIADTSSTTAEIRCSAQQASSGFELVLARLSHMWLQQSQNKSHERSGMEVSGAETAIMEVLDGLAATGALKEVLRWLQLEEDVRRAHDRLSSNHDSSSEDVVDTLTGLLAPPTLQQMLNERHLQDGAVQEQLVALRRSYNPYLSREVQQFIHSTALAAYAELYGDTAQALRRLTRLSGGTVELSKGHLDGVVAVRISAVEGFGVYPGGLASYSLAELQHHAAFGLPVLLCLSAAAERKQRDEIELLRSALQCVRISSGDTSLLAYIAVRLSGQWVAFPTVLTHAELEDPSGGSKGAFTPRVTAHVLRDADLLADFVLTSAAAADDGQAQAWIVIGADAVGHSGGGSRRRRTPLLPKSGAAPTERLLPAGTPALTYMDCLRRLHSLSITVRQAMAGMNSKSQTSGNRSGGGGSPGHPFSVDPSSGLWTEHFAEGLVPTQRYVGSLTPSMSALLSGTGGTRASGAPVPPGKKRTDSAIASLQTLLASVSETVRFSSAQVEALHSLTSGGGLGALTPPSRSGSHRGWGAGGGGHGCENAPVSVKAVDGCTGSGKTAVLYASALVRGKLHAAARHEQQRCVQAELKEAMGAVKRAASALREAAVTDLFVTSPDTNAGRDLLEEADRVAVQARTLHRQLSENFLYCSTPLLLRPAVATSAVPESVAQLLFSHDGKDAAERGEEQWERNARSTSTAWQPDDIVPLRILASEALSRTLNAPLAAQLNIELRRLGATGLWSGRGRSAEAVSAPLLSLTLSARDAADVANRVASFASTEAATSLKVVDTWAKGVATELWPEREVMRSFDDDASLHSAASQNWAVLTAAPEERFTPVTMPVTTHLSTLSREQLEGWYSVYLAKQRELAHHIHASVHEGAKSLFQLFIDLVWGVAATSQSTRHTLFCGTPAELTQGALLPLLWCWQPAHLCVDDVDAIQDGFFAMLTPASSFVYSLTSEVPAFQERRRSKERIVLALLRSLRAELMRSGDLTTTTLRESLRCRRAEVQALLRCTIEDARGLSKTVEEAATRGADRTEQDSVEGEPASASEARRIGSDSASPSTSFPGLASFSAVEMWTHGVSRDNCVAADAAATVFLLEYLCSYADAKQGGDGRSASAEVSPPRISFGVYTSTAAEAEAIVEALSTSALSRPLHWRQSVCVWKEALEDTGNGATRALSAVTTAPTADQAISYTSLEEMECEADVGVVCLSGLLEVVLASLRKGRAASDDAPDAGSYRPEVRQQQWKQLWAEAPDGSESSFVTQLQWWLWRLLRRVRRGVFLIGSRELFACVPLFAKAESLVQEQRVQLAPMDHRAYWLPPQVGGSVLALMCPDHFKCRRIAIVKEHDDGTSATSPTGDEVRRESPACIEVHGPKTCLSLCLKPYSQCPHPSHACLLPCHAQHPIQSDYEDTGDGKEEEGVATTNVPHHNCPYPCGAVLPCGHTCLRMCGEACEPCTYVGLAELPCGQRVVSGMDGSKAILYTVFPHFQERRCGEAAAPCLTPVSVVCTRCGSRALVPCHRVTSQLLHRRNEMAEEEREKLGGVDPEAYILGETACVGCVSLYNKVANKFGHELLPVPRADLTGAEQDRSLDGAADAHMREDDNGDAVFVGTPFPRHTLSADAQAALHRELTIAAKKAELLLMKEALEISSGRDAETYDYAIYRAKYEALTATQGVEEKARRDAYQAILDKCAVRLRRALETQTALNTELETLMPRLLSEATEEAQTQRAQFSE